VQPPNQDLLKYTAGLLALMAVLWFGIARQRFPGPPLGESVAKPQSGLAAERR
jgi:hypothetical protein